jgi:versiconal hemiacetal acetate esterase
MMEKLTFPAPDETVKTEERTIDGGIPVRIYYPPGYAGGKYVGVWFHSGGWVLGDLNIDDADCRALSKSSGSIIVSIDYRLAPKHVFPAAIDDCYAGAVWTAKNAASLGGVPDKVFLIGDSAGSQLVLATALKMVDEGCIGCVKGLVAQEPTTVHPDVVPENLKSQYTSYDEFSDYTVDSKPAMMAFYGKWMPYRRV